MHNNGFTLLETLLVLSLVTLCSFLYVSRPRWSFLHLEMNKILSQCLIQQQKAFSQKREVHIAIERNTIYYDGNPTSLPSDMVCQPTRFHYNAKGNISRAFTLTCHNQSQEGQLVFQLGMGRVRKK